jgi:hypothetical protein
VALAEAEQLTRADRGQSYEREGFSLRKCGGSH